MPLMHRLLPKSPLRSLSIMSGLFGAASQTGTKSSILSYTPSNPDGAFPYSKADLTPMDPGNDADFYAPARFVTHIDDNAILTLKKYYDDSLPKKGRILDFCSSWISHYPPSIAEAVRKGELTVVGTGMNEAELDRNSMLSAWTLQDLNENPDIKLPGDSKELLDASTCVVSIDYLTRPVDVLLSVRSKTKEGGTVHLAISNRCFPTKAVGRWLKIDEKDRLEMVGDYLYWAGWRNIQIVTVVEPGSWLKDPLWVVRATNTGG